MTATAPSLARAFALCALAYVLALVAALGTGSWLGDRDPLLVVAVADVAATLVVFAFSFACDNSSFYDPYWSVAPIPIAVYFAVHPLATGDPIRRALVVVLVAAYGARLTWNWARGWHGLAHEDWRYVDLRQKTGRAYWLVSLLGLHLMPTAMVLAGCLALRAAFFVGTRPFGALDVVAALVTAGAVLIEGTADNQLRAFRLAAPPPGSTLEAGLWRYSRHPNYFGEVSFWWGLALFAVASGAVVPLAFAGALAITALFLFVSIPMIDKRMLSRRPDYRERMRRVSPLVPLPPRR